MAWTTPSYDEIMRWNAEIGSYQQDGDGDNVPIVSLERETRSPPPRSDLCASSCSARAPAGACRSGTARVTTARSCARAIRRVTARTQDSLAVCGRGRPLARRQRLARRPARRSRPRPRCTRAPARHAHRGHRADQRRHRPRRSACSRCASRSRSRCWPPSGCGRAWSSATCCSARSRASPIRSRGESSSSGARSCSTTGLGVDARRGVGQAAGAPDGPGRPLARGQRGAAHPRPSSGKLVVVATALGSLDGTDPLLDGADVRPASTARSGARTSCPRGASARPARATWRTSPSAAEHGQPRAPVGGSGLAASTRTSTTPTPSSAPEPPSVPPSRRRAGRSRSTEWRSHRERRPLVGRRLHRAPAQGGLVPLPRPAPLQRAHARGRAVAGRAAPLGREPLLLPDAHPHQGRAHPVQERRSGLPAQLDPPHRRPRRRPEGEGGLHEWLLLAKAVGLDVDEVRACRARAARRALRVRRVRRLWCASARSSRPWPRRSPSSSRPSIMRTRIAAWEKHYPWAS